MRFLTPVLSLALWRGASGGRDSNDNAVAVDTEGHFRRSGFDHRREAEEDVSDSSNYHTQEGHLEDALLDPANLERMGHQIAKGIAKELHQKQQHQLDETISKPTNRNLKDEHISGSGFLETLAEISRNLDDVKQHEEAASSKAISSDTRLDGSSRTIHKKRMDNIRRSGRKKEAEVASSSQEVAERGMDGSTEQRMPRSGSSLRELAKIFEPIHNPADIFHATDLSLAHHEGKKRKQPGLNAIATNLLELKEAVVHEGAASKGRAETVREGAASKGRAETEKLPEWEQLDPEGNGSISYNDFKKIIGEDNKNVEKMFKMIDKDGSGKIDKEEYMAAAFPKQETPESKQLGQMIDQDQKSGCFQRLRTHILVFLVAITALTGS